MPTQTTSIQSRLLKYLLIGLPLLWLAISSIISLQLWHEINEISDSQIVQLTRYLLATSTDDPILNHKVPTLGTADDHDQDKDEPTIYQITKKQLPYDFGEAKDNYIGFAIWDKNGKLLMADENGQQFSFLSNHQGYLETDNEEFQRINPFSRHWRLFYAHDDDNGRVIAVGQNLLSRREVLLQALLAQTLPSIIGLFAFLALVVWSIRRGFAPLNEVSHSLSLREPQDDRPLSADVPKEIQPIVTALNQLFIKVAETLEREKRFTADASHELRSPLTALKLQANVLEQQILQSDLTEDDAELLFHHTRQISERVDTANHLVEQLLILAKLAPEQGLDTKKLEPIDWIKLSDQVLSSVNRQAREKNCQLKRDILTEDAILPLLGNATLLQILLRNLLDNAIRYCPNGSIITLQLGPTSVSVSDNGHGVSEQNLARLSERFFRPAGQIERGSGLGLSIVKRIAELHGLEIHLANIIEQGDIKGFKATLQKVTLQKTTL